MTILTLLKIMSIMAGRLMVALMAATTSQGNFSTCRPLPNNVGQWLLPQDPPPARRQWPLHFLRLVLALRCCTNCSVCWVTKTRSASHRPSSSLASQFAMSGAWSEVRQTSAPSSSRTQRTVAAAEEGSARSILSPSSSPIRARHQCVRQHDAATDPPCCARWSASRRRP